MMILEAVPDKANWLDRNIQQEECVVVLKALGKENFLGWDGLPTIEFFISFWDILKEPVTWILNRDFRQEGSSP